MCGNTSTQVMETGRCSVQSHPWLHSEFKAVWGDKDTLSLKKIVESKLKKVTAVDLWPTHVSTCKWAFTRVHIHVIKILKMLAFIHLFIVCISFCKTCLFSHESGSLSEAGGSEAKIRLGCAGETLPQMYGSGLLGLFICSFTGLILCSFGVPHFKFFACTG